MLILLLMSILTAADVPIEILQQRYVYGKLARERLIHFARLTSPLPSEPLDIRHSKYVAAAHHDYLAGKLEVVRTQPKVRIDIEIPYRHGKTELFVRKLAPWVMGNKPDKNIGVLTHTDMLAWEHGRDVRDLMSSPGYRVAFPEKAAQLRDDSKSKDRLQVNGGGTIYFLGRGSIGGGIGFDLLIVDDLFKNAEEARSQTVRDSAWHAFIADAKSRLNEESGGIVLGGTRRHEDDVQGRLLDPTNPHYDPKEGERYEVIRLPALAENDDPLGRKVDDPLWPERFSYEFWNELRTHRSEIVRMDFQVQGQCNPIPEEGNYFKTKWLKTYQPEELPRYLREYGASDHAYKDGQQNDRSCLIPAGVDASGVLWILPDVFWDRVTTDITVEAWLDLMRRHKFLTWFAAKDAISGSIGPFLNKRMREERVYLAIEELKEDKDLIRRAQSIRNRCAMGMVRFPAFAPWWGQALKEMVAFPNGKHDDLVAALAILGMGLDQMVGATEPLKPTTGLPKPGTMQWVRGQNDRTEAQARAAKARAGW